MCAGPGGKTVMLAAIGVQEGAIVTAVEPMNGAELVEQNTRGLPVEVLRADGPQTDFPQRGFDRVLVDAPHGAGSTARCPEARWEAQPGDVAPLAKLQRELLPPRSG